MGVSAITPAALLVPVLVKMVRSLLAHGQCGRRGVGRIRRDFSAMGAIPHIAAAEHMLSACCRDCGKCPMSRR